MSHLRTRTAAFKPLRQMRCGRRRRSRATLGATKPEGETFSDAERARLTNSLAGLEGQLSSLIEAARGLRKDAQLAKMNVLEHHIAA